MFPGFPGGSVIICLPMQEMQEIQVRSLGGEEPLENGNPLQYSCLRHSIDEAGGLQSVGLQRRTRLSDCVCMHGLVSITFVLHVSSIVVH